MSLTTICLFLVREHIDLCMYIYSIFVYSHDIFHVILPILGICIYIFLLLCIHVHLQGGPEYVLPAYIVYTHYIFFLIALIIGKKQI